MDEKTLHLCFDKLCFRKTANDSFVSKTGLRVKDFEINFLCKRVRF